MEGEAGLSRELRIMLAAACFVIIIAGMRAAAEIIVPFLLSVLIAIIFSPPLLWMQEKKVPKLLAVTVIVVFLLGIAYWLLIVIGGYIADFTSMLSEYQDQLLEESAFVIEFLQRRGIGLSGDAIEEHFDPSAIMQVVAGFLTSLGTAVTNVVLILVIVIFILLEVSGMPDKIRAAVDQPDESLKDIARITKNVKRYLVIKTIVALMTGVTITIWLMVQGVNYAPLWGLLAFLLNYIPKIGSLVAAIPAVIMALVQLGLWHAAMAGLGFGVVNLVIGYLLEPKMMGGGLGMSPLVVILSLVFWGWVLGAMGLILSIPLTMIFKITMESHEETRWLGIMLDDAPKQSV
jgi:AI-2 transport protein TqsA